MIWSAIPSAIGSAIRDAAEWLRLRPRPPLPPEIWTATFDKDTITVRFSTGESATIESPVPRRIVSCAIDEFQLGLDITCEEGTKTSVSSGYIKYKTDPEFARGVDAYRDYMRRRRR